MPTRSSRPSEASYTCCMSVSDKGLNLPPGSPGRTGRASSCRGAARSAIRPARPPDLRRRGSSLTTVSLVIMCLLAWFQCCELGCEHRCTKHGRPPCAPWRNGACAPPCSLRGDTVRRRAGSASQSARRAAPSWSGRRRVRRARWQFASHPRARARTSNRAPRTRGPHTRRPGSCRRCGPKRRSWRYP